MSVRPRAQQSALKPFMAPEGEGGAPAQSDSGGASFLGQARETSHHALHACVEEQALLDPFFSWRLQQVLSITAAETVAI